LKNLFDQSEARYGMVESRFHQTKIKNGLFEKQV
jgi:hypothetical protein